MKRKNPLNEHAFQVHPFRHLVCEAGASVPLLASYVTRKN